MKRWAPWEHAKLIALVKEGKTCREMARIIGRSQCAVRGRARTFKMRWRDVEPPKVITMTAAQIRSRDVPDWYEQGWRFVGFNGELCVMERHA